MFKFYTIVFVWIVLMFKVAETSIFKTEDFYAVFSNREKRDEPLCKTINRKACQDNGCWAEKRGTCKQLGRSCICDAPPPTPAPVTTSTPTTPASTPSTTTTTSSPATIPSTPESTPSTTTTTSTPATTPSTPASTPSTSTTTSTPATTPSTPASTPLSPSTAPTPPPTSPNTPPFPTSPVTPPSTTPVHSDCCYVGYCMDWGCFSRGGLCVRTRTGCVCDYSVLRPTTHYVDLGPCP